MSDQTPKAPAYEPNLFEVTIESPTRLHAVHRAEGHTFVYTVEGPDGARVLSDAAVLSGNPAHDPLAYRHAALLRVRAVAIEAQMIDQEHSVVSMVGRRRQPYA